MGMSTKYHPQSVALALIGYYTSWYKGAVRNIADTGKIRGDLALEFLQKARDYGYRVVFVDGGSSHSFLQELKKVQGIIFEEMRENVVKRSPKKQRAYVLASKIKGVKVIVSVEAEKLSLLDSISKIVTPLLIDQVAIVIPKREEKLFKESYPHFQYLSEKQANKEYNHALRKQQLLMQDQEDLDILFGPIAFQNTSELLPLFLQRVKFRKYEDGVFPSEFHDPDQYSNAYFFPTILALKHNFKVQSVTIPFTYPVTQKENEEVLEKEFEKKRILQREGILSNLYDFLEYQRKKI